ncbi:MAG: hypothetical protein ACLR2E_10190 [Lachnospiraceae bacterium]
MTDGVMLDIKSWDLEDHLRVTGAANERVLKNLEYLAASGRLFEVRTVVVPELFDCEKTVRETARLAASYLGRGNIRYKIIAYRPMGSGKLIRITMCLIRHFWITWQSWPAGRE